MNKRILAAFTAIAVAASTLTILSFANDDSVKDGVPVLNGTFEESAAYQSANDPPLGIANVFHLFAFDDITLNAHCNGNFAAPTVNALQASGTNQKDNIKENPDVEGTGTHPDISGEISLATKSLQIQGTTKVDQLLIPKDNHVITDANGDIISESKMTPKPVAEDGKVVGQIKIGADKESAQLVDMQDSYVAFIGESYVDFAAYQEKYGDLSKALAELDQNIYLTADKNAQRATVELTDEKTYVLNITAEELLDYQNGFDIKNVIFKDTDGDGDKEYPGTQCLIINVDMSGYNEYTTNSQVTIYRTDDSTVNNKEDNVLDGTIVLWNIYDSSNDIDGCYHGTYTYGKTSLGSVLAPYAKINANQNVDGNIIANSIYTGAESHRCDFMGPLPVSLQKPGTTPSEPDEGDNEPEVTTPASTPDPEGDNEPEVTTPASTPDPEGDNEPEVTTPASTPDSEGDNEPEVTTPASTPDSEGDNEPEVTTPASTPDSEGDNEPEVTTPVSSPEPEVSTSPSTADSGVAPDDDDNNTTTTTTVPVASPESTTTTANDGVADDGDDNGKTTTTSTTTTTAHNEGVADGGDGNDKDTGMGSDGDENNRPPKTGDSAPAALAVALIGSAIVITALKKNKDK